MTSTPTESFTAMKGGDVEAVGAHCQMEYCHVLDFLPFRCESCRGYVCATILPYMITYCHPTLPLILVCQHILPRPPHRTRPQMPQSRRVGTATRRPKCVHLAAAKAVPVQPRATMLREHVQDAHQHVAHARKPVLVVQSLLLPQAPHARGP